MITKSLNFTVFTLDGQICFRVPGKAQELWYLMITNNDKDNKGITMITKSLTSTVFVTSVGTTEVTLERQ